ncbi:transcriptional regulator, IclR family [Prauserella alba]|uniref:IclR family transcriptional regulator C-terminal domain-containing protein n=1 Tax=Prauserella alba TaxID=176898 RepID=A0ABP4G0V5_9PSEU|nr:transcriptional regulator, IclR family [Prauserella alba]
MVEVALVSEGPTLIGSVQRALHLLDAVGASARPVTAKHLARTVGVPLPTTYHLLRTLVHEGYLRKLEDGYVLGERLRPAAPEHASQRLLTHVRPILRALRDELHGAAYLALYTDGEIELVDIVDGPDTPTADLWVGAHEAGHATAFGKCILATLPTGERADYLARHRLADLTPHTITDARALEHALATGGEVFDDRQEYLLGTACVGGVVHCPGVLGAVAVSLPARRYRPTRTAARAMQRAAHRVTRAAAADTITR